MQLQPFHLAIPVDDLQAARKFYTGVLGCTTGRSDTHWIDFNLYGHQLVCHQTDTAMRSEMPVNIVDGEAVPVPHFGVVLGWEDWESLARRLAAAGVNFLIAPTLRFAGKTGEQATMFFSDPSGNMLEFKAFRDPDQLFAV
jgi:extradiol dioxygenase family protein